MNYTLTADAGLYSIIGSPSLSDYSLTAETGLLQISGQGAEFIFGHGLFAVHGLLTITGQPASLTWSGLPVFERSPDRTFAIAAQSRRLSLPAELRVLPIPVESAELVV